MMQRQRGPCPAPRSIFQPWGGSHHQRQCRGPDTVADVGQEGGRLRIPTPFPRVERNQHVPRWHQAFERVNLVILEAGPRSAPTSSSSPSATAGRPSASRTPSSSGSPGRWEATLAPPSGSKGLVVTSEATLPGPVSWQNNHHTCRHHVDEHSQPA